MSLHLRPVPPQNALDRAKYVERHNQLRAELEDMRKPIEDRHERRLRRSNEYRLRGGDFD